MLNGSESTATPGDVKDCQFLFDSGMHNRLIRLSCFSGSMTIGPTLEQLHHNLKNCSYEQLFLAVNDLIDHSPVLKTFTGTIQWQAGAVQTMPNRGLSVRRWRRPGLRIREGSLGPGICKRSSTCWFDPISRATVSLMEANERRLQSGEFMQMAYLVARHGQSNSGSEVFGTTEVHRFLPEATVTESRPPP